MGSKRIGLRSALRKSLGLASTLLLGAGGIVALSAPATAAGAVVNSVTFKAPVHNSYDHKTGGGAFNDGSVTYSKGELLGTNFKCGDYASFVFELDVNASPSMAAKGNGKYDVIVRLDYTTDATGQSGVGLQPDITPAHLKVNSGVIAAPGVGTGQGGSDGGFSPAGSGLTTTATITNASQVQNGTFFSSGSTNRITFTVTDLTPGTVTIVRSDAKILCNAGMSPTGNLQASLASATATNGSATEAVSAGNQTVNFRGVGDIVGASAPALTVTKSVSNNGTDCSSTSPTRTLGSAPQSVLYCYTVVNDGTQAATNVRLKDDNATPGNTSDDFFVNLSYTQNSTTTSSSGSPLTLASLPGGGVAATGTATVNYAADGNYTNTATLTAGNHGTLTTTANVVVGSAPNLTIVKTQTSGTPTAVGQNITYSVVATNSGTLPITNVNLTDSNAVLSGCTPALPVATLAVGATISCTATHAVINADVLSGSVVNVVDGAFTSNATNYTRQSNAVTTSLNASMSVVNTQTSNSVPTAAGDIITYSIVVTNTGSMTLSGVNLTNANATLGTCTPALPVASLAPNATITCTASRTVTSGDVTAGSVSNIAIASTTTGPISQVTSNTVTTNVVPPAQNNQNNNQNNNPAPQATPNVNITKSLKSQAPKKAGDTVVYTVKVTNTGNVQINDNKVIDPDGKTLVCPAGSNVLAVGATIECEVSYVVTQDDVNKGKIVRDAKTNSVANGLDKTSNEVVVPLEQKDDLVIEQKQVGGNPKKPGDPIRYQIVTKNTGNITLKDVLVTNTAAVIESCTPALPVAALDPGQQIVCTATYKVTAEDIRTGVVNNASTALAANFTKASLPSNEVVTPLKDAVLTGELAETGDDLTFAYLFGASLVLAGALVLRRARKLS